MKKEDNNIIEVAELTKRFGSLTAVNQISFSVKEGEILGFLGPNGAGKTTTIRMLTGLLTPDSGNIFIDGFLSGAKWALLSTSVRKNAEEIAEKTSHIQLCLDSQFQREFADAMIFP